MTRRMTIIFGISGWVKIVAIYCHAIFWGTQELREGWVKIMLIVSCLEWLTYLFLFIMVEFKRYYLKIVPIFLVMKVFQKGTMF